MILKTVLSAIAASAFALLSLQAQAHTNTAQCTFAKFEGEFRGICSIPRQVNNLAVNFDGLKTGYMPNFEADRVVSAYLQKTDNGYAGKMTGRKPEDPTLFEINNGADGKPAVGKLPFGWFNVQASEITEENMAITFDVETQIGPSAEDLVILRRAGEIMSSNEVWNKQDTRVCSANAAKVSVFCALLKATKEVTGRVHYRQPALQAAREVVNGISKGRYKLHRIQQWNNDEVTTLEDVHALLKQAEENTRQRIAAQ